jgi:hypothetical protein
MSGRALPRASTYSQPEMWNSIQKSMTYRFNPRNGMHSLLVRCDFLETYVHAKTADWQTGYVCVPLQRHIPMKTGEVDRAASSAPPRSTKERRLWQKVHWIVTSNRKGETKLLNKLHKRKRKDIKSARSVTASRISGEKRTMFWSVTPRNLASPSKFQRTSGNYQTTLPSTTLMPESTALLAPKQETNIICFTTPVTKLKVKKSKK